MDRPVLKPPTLGLYGRRGQRSTGTPTVYRLLSELSAFSALGAFLVVLSLSWWSMRLMGLDKEMVREQSMLTELARVEVQIDSVLTLGDLVFYSHSQDFLVPAMRTHIQQLQLSLERLDEQSKDVFPQKDDVWAQLLERNQNLAKIVESRQTTSGEIAIATLTRQYDENGREMVQALLEANERVSKWSNALGGARYQANRSRFMMNLGLLFAYLMGVIFLWRRTSRLIAHPLRRLQSSAEEALNGASKYNHQTMGAAEVIDVSYQMDLLIGHLEGQVQQRTRSLSVQTARLEAEVKERIEKDKALRERNRELQNAMNQLAKVQSALLKKARLEALGQMAGGIAHDFNNALTPIAGTSELLAESIDSMSPEEVRECISLIQLATTDAAELIQRLRASFIGVEEMVFQEVDLTAVAESAIQLTRTDWGRLTDDHRPMFKVTRDFQKGVLVWGNTGQLRQAIVNLIVNAVHASQGGGEIVVSAKSTESGPAISVKDHGQGMTPEVLSNCLKPLYTTKGSEGTGLGLMNVAGTAREHGGRLQIDSEPGSGTTVTIHLLGAPERALMSPERQGWQHHNANREALISQNFPTLKLEEQNTPLPATRRDLDVPPRVFLVDDDVTVLGVIKKVISRAGYEVRTENSPMAVLSSLQGDLPDVLITDFNMPEMTGGELATRIREAHPQLPILLMTGLRGEAELTLLENGIIDHIISKPIKIVELFDRINHCLDR